MIQPLALDDIIKPGNETQEKFLSLTDVKEVTMISRAGTGKSFALLLSFLSNNNHLYREHNGIIFRKNTEDLQDLIKKSFEIFPNVGATFTGKPARWIFPSGATLTLSHLDNEVTDILRYQGGEYSFIGWDELPQFTRESYLFMFSRLRCRNKAVKLMVRSTGNPWPPKGFLWVKERFIDVSPKNYIRFFKMIDDVDTEVSPEEGVSRCWIEAKEIIKYIDKDDYEKNLKMMPQKQQKAFLTGEFTLEDEIDQLISYSDVERALAIKDNPGRGFWILGVDPAGRGGDSTILTFGRMNKVLDIRSFEKTNTDGKIKLISEYLDEYKGQILVVIDMGGGHADGTVDGLQKKYPEYLNHIIGIGNKSAQLDEQMKRGKYATILKFDSYRSQLCWYVRDSFENNLIDLSEVKNNKNINRLKKEIVSMTYDDLDGIIKVIKKSELKKTMHVSPDAFDSLMYYNTGLRFYADRMRTKPAMRAQDGTYYGFNRKDKAAPSVDWF